MMLAALSAKYTDEDGNLLGAVMCKADRLLITCTFCLNCCKLLSLNLDFSNFCYVENLLQFNLPDFSVDFIKQFVSFWGWAVLKICVYLLSQFY